VSKLLKKRSIDTVDVTQLEIYISGERIGPEPTDNSNELMFQSQAEIILAKKKNILWIY
jgi:6-phosphogluconolactonase/glucosamine-6-phosphate isomerase/deaminase